MTGEVTEHLSVLGDPAADTQPRREAQRRLFDLLYAELHGIADHIAKRQKPGGTLQATALLHEAYLRLAGNEALSAKDRHHFIATAAMAMRRVLVDHFRARKSLKRGGERRRVPLDDLADAYIERAVDLDVLDRGLQKLGETDERAATVVDLHFFGGLSTPEIAEVLGITPRTVRRDLEFARTWLRGAFR